jgi:hypothetical protein
LSDSVATAVATLAKATADSHHSALTPIAAFASRSAEGQSGAAHRTRPGHSSCLSCLTMT